MHDEHPVDDQCEREFAAVLPSIPDCSVDEQAAGGFANSVWSSDRFPTPTAGHRSVLLLHLVEGPFLEVVKVGAARGVMKRFQEG